MRHRICPVCYRAEQIKVLYFGLPGLLCVNEECHALTGMAAWLPPIATEDPDGEPAFKFFAYEGSYLKALWQYLTGDTVHDD